jgi:uncharacterized membrane protein
MVDIAVRALSPAVNDPTTAVQVLDYLGETLRRVGANPRPTFGASAEGRTSGVIMPVRSWADFLALAMTEIREYGAASIQVMRRLRAVLNELRELVAPEHREAVDEEIRRLQATVMAEFGGGMDLDRAMSPDHQGIGGPSAIHRHPGYRVAP